MMYFIVFGLIAAVSAQRPFYAGSRPIGVPDLANRFKDTSSPDQTIVNRVAEATPTSTRRIPIDARGDQELVDRLEQWPRENQPFWLLNAQHIENHRNPQPNRKQVQSRNSFDADPTIKARPIRPTIPRSPFLGPISRR
ncbi:hypothetical protein NQ318_009369 [Aromia moschata]|uniref:Uncharacterized protein n=1 Tax=Aromia moschata TaxID=1265417 RepID=A0AAV8XEK8_9CUCU|nr:hypothetical protein NQ318_009369 [Aromia moschata]